MGAALTFFFAAAVYGSLFIVSRIASDGSIAVLPASLMMPVMVGFAAQALVDPTIQHKISKVWLWSLYVTGALGLALLSFGIETIICIAMALPIFLPLQFVGVVIARLLLNPLLDRMEKGRMQASVLGVMLLGSLVPMNLDFPETHHLVRSTVIIDAPVQTVWNHTVEIPEIQADERIWRLSHHILQAPQPVSAVMENGVRQLRWTQGVRFEEHITAQDAPHHLAWRFAFPDKANLLAFDTHISPTGPELYLDHGFYTLTALADGRTQLDLETYYRLKTPLDGYLTIWGQVFLNDFHTAVLHVIKTRAEAGNGRE